MSDLTRRIAALSPQQRAAFERRLKQRGINPPALPIIPKRPDSAAIPLSFGQQRLWFLDQLEPGNPSYNFTGAVRLTGSLDIGALAASLNEIVRRHEALRTTFAAVEGRPYQVISPSLHLPLPLVDLCALP